MDNRKLTKIYNKIDKLAIFSSNEVEYYNYINELISKGEYYLFVEVLLRYYKIDISDENNINDFRKETWKEICFQTESSFARNLNTLYKDNDVYQLGQDIYSGSTNLKIGTIKETEVISPDYGTYIKNRMFSKLTGLINTYLEVIKVGEEDNPVFIADQYDELNDDRNLIIRYELAITYLLS